MKSKKAFIKLDGTIGEKEHSCIEYIDEKYSENMQKQISSINESLSNTHSKKINAPENNSPKSITELNGFKIGETVKVKAGIVDPDDDKTEISDWCGRIKEIYDDGIALIAWDSITIRRMKLKNIKKYEKEGYIWSEMCLGLYEIDKTEPRDGIDDADEEISKIQWQYFRKEYFPEYNE